MTPTQREAALRLAEYQEKLAFAVQAGGDSSGFDLMDTAALLRELAEVCTYPDCGCPIDKGSACGKGYTVQSAEPAQEPVAPIEETLKRAYYYTEDGEWRDADLTTEWDRWHAVAKVVSACAVAEPAQEPVAWAVYTSDEFMRVFDAEDDAVRWHQQETSNGSPYIYRVVPLYAAPQQRQLLTDEQILTAAGRLPGWLRHHEELDCDDLIDFARAIEAAHGIGGKE